MRKTLTLLILSVLCAGTASAQKPVFAYITNFGSQNVSIIDLRTNKVVDTVHVGSFPFGVAATPDGEFVYVVNFDDSSVSVISIFDNNNVVDTVLRVGFHLLFVAITPFDPRQGNDSGGGRRLMLLGIIQSLQWFSYTVSPDSNIYSDCQALEKNQTKA